MAYIFRHHWYHHPTGKTGWAERVYDNELQHHRMVARWAAQNPKNFSYWADPYRPGRKATDDEVRSAMRYAGNWAPGVHDVWKSSSSSNATTPSS